MPPIPKGLPQIFNSFFMQLQVPCSDNLRNAIITETMEPATENILPFILDIDVFQERGLSYTNLVENFNQIRLIKNEVFENCISQKALLNRFRTSSTASCLQKSLLIVSEPARQC